MHRWTDAMAELAALLGDGRLSRNPAVCEQHGRGEGWHPAAAPDAVAFPVSTAEVSAIIRVCARHRMPVVAFGAGTSVEGQVTAPAGGLSLDMGRMNQILAFHPEDFDVIVQPGVTRKQLGVYLRDTGLFFPIDPGADATLGGMAATRASGTNAVRYGTMRDSVLALEAVLADGQVIRAGTRAKKSAAGYDLARLLVGSEGTLGLITELTLRLAAVPEAVSAATCSFPDVAAAVEAVIAAIQSAIPLARVELLDAAQMAATNAYAGLDHPVAPTLFLEFHGSAAGVAEQAEAMGAICAEYGGSGFRWASLAEERNRLWQARHDVHYAAQALRPGCRAFTTDVCVPISRLGEVIGETRADIDRIGLLATMAGHVGDGNFHAVLLVDPGDSDEVARARAVADRLAARAQAAGGTCTGEHGVGIGKLHHLDGEHGAAALRAMAAIKRALDPLGILNPGKTVPIFPI